MIQYSPRHTLLPYTPLFRSPAAGAHRRHLTGLRRRMSRLQAFRWGTVAAALLSALGVTDRKSTRLNSSHLVISYAVFCLKKKIQLTLKLNVSRMSQVSTMTP